MNQKEKRQEMIDKMNLGNKDVGATYLSEEMWRARLGMLNKDKSTEKAAPNNESR